MNALTIRYVGQGTEPTQGSAKAGAMDLYASEDVELKPFEPTLVSTGLFIELPPNHDMLVLPRSGNALKKKLMVANAPGLIDEDYRGEVKVILTYCSLPKLRQTMGGTPFYDESDVCVIKKGERIAQCKLVKNVPQMWTKVEALSETDRGDGGFGSTGV